MRPEEVLELTKDSARFFSYVKNLPALRRELCSVLSLPKDSPDALLYAKLAHRWAGDGHVFNMIKDSERLTIFFTAMLNSKLLTPSSMTELLVGESAPTQSSAALIMWANTHQFSTQFPESGDLAVFRVKGRQLAVGMVVDYKDNTVVYIKPGSDGEERANTTGLTFIKLGAGKSQGEAATTQEAREAVQESAS